VALAADEGDAVPVTGSTPAPNEEKVDARHKAERVIAEIERTREKAKQRRERARAHCLQVRRGPA
jgi:hypothetical protein